MDNNLRSILLVILVFFTTFGCRPQKPKPKKKKTPVKVYNAVQEMYLSTLELPPQA